MSVTRTNKLLDKATQGKAQMTKDIAALIAKNKDLTKQREERDVTIAKLTSEVAELTEKLDMAGAEIEDLKKSAETEEEGKIGDIATAVPVE
ncbi:MAG: hypothetical protein PHX83_06530 [Acidobacteriia bacterium]|nr:hypothetical protein [Terriglobia bacterium]